MDRNVYSFALSDGVVAQLDKICEERGISRSLLVDRILADYVGYTTPEMQINSIIDHTLQCMSDFFIVETPKSTNILAKSNLRYRYNPTISYSLDLWVKNGKRYGELKMFHRTKNPVFLNDMEDFLKFWLVLERNYISAYINQDLSCEISPVQYVRELNIPQEDIQDNKLAQHIASYVEMFDKTLKCYFAQLPDVTLARTAAEKYYKAMLKKQKIIL